MAKTAVALGSNLDSPFGDREANLREAVRRLSDLGKVTAVSSFRLTEPVGYLDQPAFLNGVALLETEVVPLDLLRALLGIEKQMGRDRSHGIAKGPRSIDLDLLLYDEVTMQTEELTLPHSEMTKRLFVLQPLAEIAPEWIVPGSDQTVAQIFSKMRKESNARLRFR